jgi:hypothetical protein
MGRACKWRASLKLMEMMEGEKEETSSTETDITTLDDFLRPRPSWLPQRQDKEQMRMLMNRVGALFEGKRRLAA